MNLRVGLGYDLHPLTPGRDLILGGVKIPFAQGLSGHSDADVLIHAVIDALLGAAGLGDIGSHFPDHDPRYRNISSLILLKQTLDLITQAGWSVVNMDTIIQAEKPKLTPYFEAIRSSLAQALNLTTSQLNIKAKTSERLGCIGRQEAIAAHAVVMLQHTGKRRAYRR